MNWISWAFDHALPTAEKLVLVYLATQVNAVGLGSMNRAGLESCTGYKKRSIQRLLKNLRDAELLHEHGPWYMLGRVRSDEELAELPAAPPNGMQCVWPPAPPHSWGNGGRPMTLQEIADAEGGGEIPGVDADAIGEAIADKVIDAAEYMADQLQNVEARFAQQIDRLALLHVEQAKVEPEPPDPVREDPRFTGLLDMGVPEDIAYQTIERTRGLEAERETEPNPPQEQTRAPETREPAEPAVSYPDTPEGRCARVKDILEGTWSGPPEAGELRAWQALEQTENAHTVKGEVDAFDLLYPAIVAAARQHTKRMTLAEFISPAAIAQGKAPWDQDPQPTPAEDAVLDAEINSMLADLAEVNDKRCEVGPRTTEKQDDGRTLTESIVGYHRRVKAKWQEMRKMKQMGLL